MSLTPPPSNPTLPPVAPSRNDPEELFDQRANAMVAWYAVAMTWFTTFVTWTRTFITEITALQVDVSEKSSSATVAAGTATTMRNQAVDARDVATAAAGVATGARDEVLNARTEVFEARDATILNREQSEDARDETFQARDTAVIAATQQLVATSATSFANTVGVKDLTLTTGKPFLPNVTFLRGASRSNSLAQNGGYVTEYDPATGVGKIAISEVSGPLTSFNDWDFSVGAPGGGSAGAIGVVAPNSVMNCNALPNNTITQITAPNSSYAANNLPCLVANSAQSTWGTSVVWTVETVGFVPEYAVQKAIPLILGDTMSGRGCVFVRKRESGTWGRWIPQSVLPTSIVTTTGGEMYGDALRALNRRNILSTSIASTWAQRLPSDALDGDRFEILTNARTDNQLYTAATAPANGGIRTGTVNLTASADYLVLDSANTLYRFTYIKDYASWFLE